MPSWKRLSGRLSGRLVEVPAGRYICSYSCAKGLFIRRKTLLFHLIFLLLWITFFALCMSMIKKKNILAEGYER